MANMQIRNNQVKGVEGASIGEDISNILNRLSHKSSILDTKDLLPMTGNYDGDMRLVLTGRILYMWDVETLEWINIGSISSVQLFKILKVLAEGDVLINTELTEGEGLGDTPTSSIVVYVNKVLQVREVDYSVETNQTNVIYIRWISTDFDLDPTDDILVFYTLISD